MPKATAGVNGSTEVREEAEFDAVVIGAGFAGLYMLYRLRELGLSTRVFETGTGVGGTWYWNRYPGARVDGQSLQYSYSFSPELEQEWHWPEKYSSQPELEKYLNHVADRFNLRTDIHFETTVTSATYSESTNSWTVETNRGDRITCKYLITAVGCLSATNVPEFKGLETFEGKWYHTSRWPKEGVELEGKRVGVVGTGSTGVQAIPAIAEQAEHLYVFQRTPNYCFPSFNGPMDPEFEAEWKRNYAESIAESRGGRPAGNHQLISFPDRSALSVSEEERNRTYEEAWHYQAAVVGAFNDIRSDIDANETAAEFVRNKIRERVKDPEVAELLCPKDYPIGTKRGVIEQDYFETYNRGNVTLVDVKTYPIVEILPTGLRTAAARYDLDVLVFATGFDAFTGPLERLNITGKAGLTLKKKWEAGPRTYLGLQTVGFPNLFIITGPGSPSVLATMTAAIEQHAQWIAGAINYMESGHLESIEPIPEAEDAWVDHVNELASKTLFFRGNSWYIGANIPGKPRVFMPYIGGFGTYREKCEEVVANGYEGFELKGSVTADR